MGEVALILSATHDMSLQGALTAATVIVMHEYKVVDIMPTWPLEVSGDPIVSRDSEGSEVLSEYGADGWRVVGVTTYQQRAVDSDGRAVKQRWYHYVLQREVSNQNLTDEQYKERS